MKYLTAGRSRRVILVIGGTGNIGSELIRLLVAAGAPVRALARDTARAAALLGPGVDIVAGDLASAPALASAMRGVEKLFLVTPLALDQVAMKAAAIDAARAAGVRHIVMSTGIGAGPEAHVEIGRWHGASQEHVKSTGIPWTFLQPTFFMQNMLMSAPTIRDHGAFYLPLGDGRVSWIDARDIAAAGFEALTRPGYENRELPLTGPEALSSAELAAALGAATGRSIRYVAVPPQAAREGMVGAGLPEKLADMMNELYALGPAGHLAHVLDTVQTVTGRPARTFRQFATDYATRLCG
jgi:uncharacterized protein YbjT (DUF2867 family)